MVGNLYTRSPKCVWLLTENEGFIIIYLYSLDFRQYEDVFIIE
jgi:hypothetical protein